MKDKYNLTREQNIFIAKRNIVDYIWKSANLEGIGVTYPETQAIYDGGVVNGLTVDKIIAINNLKYAWQFILENENIEYDYNALCHIHKLVAETFLNNPNGYKYINHKDENTLNNNVENLEWCSAKYNANYGNRNKKIADKLSKKINQYDLDNNFIKTWNSSMEIERTIGIDQSNVCLCCNGKRDTVGGFKWKYLDLDYLKSKGDE